MNEKEAIELASEELHFAAEELYRTSAEFKLRVDSLKVHFPYTLALRIGYHSHLMGYPLGTKWEVFDE